MEELHTPLKVSFAQNREDIFLEYFFRDVKEGFYVDIGANDPVADSVTKLFYDKGWSGINVEPMKRFYKKLQGARPRDINLNIGISSENGSTIFREYKTSHGLSTMASDMQDLHDKQDDSSLKDYDEHKVAVRTLEDVFKEYKVEHIHFLKVDVEGFEYEVLKGNNWDKYRPEIICIEANHVLNDWRPLLKNAGYGLVFNDGLNDYYAAKESEQRAKEFSYVEAALPSQILNYAAADALNAFIAKTNAERSALIHRNSELASNSDDFERRLAVATSQLEELNGLRNLGKAFLRRLNQKIENTIYPVKDRERLHLVKANPIQLVDDIKKQQELVDSYDEQYLPQFKIEADYVKSRTLKVYRFLARTAVYCVQFFLRALRKTMRLLRGSK